MRAAASAGASRARARPGGPLVWVHCASVGETNAVSAADRASGGAGACAAAHHRHGNRGARWPGRACRAGPSTSSRRSIFRRRSAASWITGGPTSRSSPNWSCGRRCSPQLRRRSIPLAVVNARMSERSFRAWAMRSRRSPARCSAAPTLFLAQTAGRRRRVCGRWALRSVAVCGNLKFDAPAPAADTAEVERDAARDRGATGAGGGEHASGGGRARSSPHIARWRRAERHSSPSSRPRHPRTR